jgi:hypothetical protein
MVAALSQVPETEPQTEESRTRFFNSASLGLGLARAKATQAYVTALVEDHAALIGKEDRDGHAA